MKIYMYAPKWSSGTKSLAMMLGAERLRRFDGIDFWDRTKRLTIEPGSVLVCWGGTVGEIPGVRILNGSSFAATRYRQFIRLSAAGLSVGQILLPEGDHGVDAYVTSGYLPRIEGRPMLDIYMNVPLSADFYVQKQVFVKETRVHVFGKTVLLGGVQVPKHGFREVQKGGEFRIGADIAHPFVKNWEGGWRTKFEDFAPTADMKAMALKAVGALGLDFGAVSIGQLTSGRYIVINVKAGPDLDEMTLRTYHKAISGWAYDDLQAERKPYDI